MNPLDARKTQDGQILYGAALHTGPMAPSAFSALADGKEISGSPSEIYKMYEEAEEAGEIFKLLVTIVPHNQGENGNFWRIKSSAYRAICKSFTGKVFLRDHCLEQKARGGTIVSSKAIGSGETAYMEQVVEVVEPWAIKGFLRGTIDRFSIGLNTHDVTAYCTICGADVMAGWCGHYPGEEYDVKGKAVVCWWEVVAGSGKETSAVVDPAVPGTYVQEIKRLAASLGGIRQPSEEEDMKIEELQAALASKEEELQAALGDVGRKEEERQTACQARADADNEMVALQASLLTEQEAHEETRATLAAAQQEASQAKEEATGVRASLCDLLATQITTLRASNERLFADDSLARSSEGDTDLVAEQGRLERILLADQILIEREARNFGPDFDAQAERAELVKRSVDALSLALDTIRSTAIPTPAPPMGRGAPLTPADGVRAQMEEPLPEEEEGALETFDAAQLVALATGRATTA